MTQTLEKYLHGLGLLLSDVRIDQQGRLFIVVEGTEVANGNAFYKEIGIPEEFQVMGNVEIITKLLYKTNERK